MKKKNIIGYILPLFLLTGCFEDKGNYEYLDLNGPVWTINTEQIPVYVTTYQGDTIRVKAPFYFAKDSTEMLARVRYEWKVNNKVICTDRNFYGVADSILAKMGLPVSQTNGMGGTFAIIDTKTGISHMARLYFTIRPWVYQGDWLILSEKGADSKVSFLKKKARTINGVVNTKWIFRDNYYEDFNETPLLGRPISLRYGQGMNISSVNGSTSIVTDKAVYTLNNENFKLHDKLNDQFMDGTPPNFVPANVFQSRLITYIATQDGRLFRRLMTDDWFQGKFMTEPYIIDSKGYNVTWFGTGQTAQGSAIAASYDELNRRVLMIRQAAPYKIMPVTLLGGASAPVPAWEMPAGTKVLHLYLSLHKAGTPESTKTFTMIFNDASGKTWMTDFVVNYDGKIIEHGNNSLEPFPAGNLPEGTRFLTSSDTWDRQQYIFYTKGNELRYVNLINKVDYPYLTFGSNVIVARYAAYNINYKQLAVGLANGDFMLYNISRFDLPVLMPETKCNVGGKIQDIMELRIDTFYDAP